MHAGKSYLQRLAEANNETRRELEAIASKQAAKHSVTVSEILDLMLIREVMKRVSANAQEIAST